MPYDEDNAGELRESLQSYVTRALVAKQQLNPAYVSKLTGSHQKLKESLMPGRVPSRVSAATPRRARAASA